MTLDDLRGRSTCTVPEAAELLGLGRDAGYAAAARGEIPTLRFGRRLVVPVPRLLELLGAPAGREAAEEAMSGSGSSPPDSEPPPVRRPRAAIPTAKNRPTRPRGEFHEQE